MRRTVRIFAFVMLIGLIGSACGARLDPNVRHAAANAVLNGGGGGGTTTGTTGTGGTGTTTGGSSTGSTSGTGTTTGGTAGTKGTKGTAGTHGSSGGTQSGGQTASGSNCPTGGTDVGLTSNSIRLGTIADVTGPVPGLFQGAQQGIQAFAAYVNSSGGLCGHSVNIDFADSGTNCGQNQNDTDSLAKKDFALVGTFSLYDGCGAGELSKYPTMPDVHVALDPKAVQPQNHFDLEPGALGYATGMWKYYASKLGSKIKNTGTIAENIPSALAKQHAELKAAQSQGWQFTEIDESPTTGDFQNDFQKLCGQKHIQVFFTVTENAQNAATMISDENKVAACKGLVNVIPIAYDQSFLTYCQQLGCGANLNTVVGWNEYSLFFNTDEAARIPEVKLFQTWFNKVNPGKPANLYAMFAWADGRMFQQAFQNAGKTANRKSVLAALKKIKKFSDNNLISPTQPSSKTSGNTCYILWQLSGGHFSRVSTPATGYRCDGSYLRY